MTIRVNRSSNLSALEAPMSGSALVAKAASIAAQSTGSRCSRAKPLYSCRLQVGDDLHCAPHLVSGVSEASAL